MKKLNIKQKILSLLVCITTLICGLFVVAPEKVYADHWVEVSSEPELLSALTNSDSKIFINLTGSFWITNGFTIPSGKTVTIYSNSGQQIVAGKWGMTMFSVEGGATLNLNSGATLNGNGQYSCNGQSSTCVNVYGNGTFNLQGGKVCQSHEHGVYGYAGSNINISSGEIYNNSAYGIGTYGYVNMSGGKIYNNNNGGIQALGGISSINMTGGEITNSSQQGGRNGIHIGNTASLNMSGGSIGNMGHAIYHDGGNCTISGGASLGNNVYLTGSRYVNLAKYMNINIEVQSFSRGRTVIQMQNSLSPITEGQRVGFDNRSNPWYLRARNQDICIWDQYTVNVSAGNNGISSVSGSGNYWYGDSCTIDANVKSGYVWSDWRGVTTTKRYTFNVDGNKNFTAYANVAQYLQVVNVRYQNADGSWGNYSSAINQNYNHGSTVSWSRNEDACYKAASLTPYTVTGAKTSYVDVYRKQYTVSLNKGTGINSVSGAGTYYYGQNCTISATPSTGYLFSGWTGNINDGRNPYSFSVSGNVTATANAKIETIDKTATINWNDKSNKNGSRPDSVTLSLYRDGEKIKDYTATGNSSVIATSNVWTYKITGLQRYNLSTGKEYKYTLTETVVSKHLDDKYVISYSDNTWTINNTLINNIDPNPESGVRVVGNITWKDNNNQYHCRPDEVTLVLYQNGNYYDELTTSSDSYEFSGLPKYDANLDPYVYTVSESPIKNYTTSYNSYDTEITENNRTSKLHHCDITNTFKPEWTPDNPIRFGDNQLTITPAVFDKDGNVANADTYTQACIEAGKSNIYITLKQLNTVFVPVDAENGVYKETYGTDYSGIEYILAMTDTSSVNMTDILYGKYEISIDKINVLTLKELKALSSENAVFSYENGKYYVTFSYAYEHAKEYLEMDLVLSSHKGYQSSMSINNYFKVETEQQPILNAYGLLRSVSHNWESDYTIDIGPTCTENGAKSIHCSDCELVKDVQSIDALGHIDEDGDGICDRCGETLSDTTEVDATDNADNTLKNEFPEESTEQPEDDSATENIEENTETK